MPKNRTSQSNLRFVTAGAVLAVTAGPAIAADGVLPGDPIVVTGAMTPTPASELG